MLRTRKVKKDGRKRTSSTASNITTPQAGPVQTEKSSPKSDSKPQAVPEKRRAAQEKPVPNVFQFLDASGRSSSSSESTSDSESSDDEPFPQTAIAKIQSPKPRSTVSPSLLASRASARKPTPPSASTSRNSSDSHKSVPPAPAPPAPSPPPTMKQVQVSRKQAPRLPAVKSFTTPDSPPSPKDHNLQITRPESYYTSKDNTALHRSPLPPSPPSSPEDSIHRDIARRRDSTSSQVSSGYGLVASYLTRSAAEEKGSFSPLYRRFESVNHRVLLHLQDEISQMEEDLHALDEYEEMHRMAVAEKEGSSPVPASRRVDAQSQAYSTLHYRRVDLMAALIHKTEQYNNALSSYSKVIQTLPRASDDDIQNYRSWMKQRNPIAASETRFLDQGVDLVSLTPRPAASAAAAPIYMSTFIAAGAILMPLLAFSMVAEFSGRLVVVTVIGGAAAAIAANYSAGIETLIDSRDGWKCATVYFGFMTVAALFTP